MAASAPIYAASWGGMMNIRCFLICALVFAIVPSSWRGVVSAQDVSPSPAASPSPDAGSSPGLLSPQWCTPGSNCPLSGGTPPVISPAAGGAFAALSSGLFTYTKTDLALPGPMPMVITRTYRSRDKDPNGNWNIRDFGYGTTLNYAIFLYSNSEVAGGTYTDAEVVMPDGSEIQCTNQGPPTPYTAANFYCGSQPIGIWFGSTITWNGTTSQWNLTRKDGTVYAFGQHLPLVSITDRYNNSVIITRNTTVAPCTNPGTQIQAKVHGTLSGRSVALCYDGTSSSHISGVFDNSGGTGSREIDYTYSSGTLTTVKYKTYNTAAVTSYQYLSGTGNVSSITTNINSTTSDTIYMSYGTGGRLSQIYHDPVSLAGPSYSYTTDANGNIINVLVSLPDNTQRSLDFDANGYLTADTRAYGSAKAEKTTYTRDAATELVKSITENAGRALSRVTNFVYDGGGAITLANLTRVTEAAGSPVVAITNIAWQSSPDFYDEISSITDPLNHSWTFGIDPATGNLISVTAPSPISSTWNATYNPTGQNHLMDRSHTAPESGPDPIRLLNGHRDSRRSDLGHRPARQPNQADHGCRRARDFGHHADAREVVVPVRRAKSRYQVD